MMNQPIPGRADDADTTLHAQASGRADQPASRTLIPPVCHAQPGRCGADLNRVHLTGCLGSEPLLTDVGDHPVATLTLACTRHGCAAEGQLHVETTWFTLAAWEDLAVYCGRWLHSGDRVYVEGRLHDGADDAAPMRIGRYTIVLERIILLTPGGGPADDRACLGAMHTESSVAA